MRTPPVVIVAGLGRCGSSMTMQMLSAGGVPCVGPWPSYEESRLMPPIDLEWLASLGGQAVKILDPQRSSIRGGGFPARVIWLDRDDEEQARSQIKFLRLMAGVSVKGDRWRALASSLRKDRPIALGMLSAWPVLVLTFEQIIANPRAAAVALRGYLAEDFDLDVVAAAGAVRRRHPACASGLDLEIALMAEAEGRRA